MKSIPFTLYDFLSYLIPGAILLWAGQVLIADVFRLPWRLRFTDSASDTLAFIIISLVAGHVVQVIARPIERTVMNIWRTPNGLVAKFPSQLFRDDSDTHYTPAFKARFEAKAAHDFHLSVKDDEAFNVAYAHVTQKDPDGHTHIFGAIYQLQKGLVVALFAIAFAYFAQFIDAVSKHPDGTIAREGALLAIVALLGVALSFWQARYFSRLFADSVFRAYVALGTT